MKPIVCSMILASIAGIAFQADAQQYTTVATPEQFSAAFEAKAERIRITADITSTSDSPYLVDKNMTIDLNGHKVTLASTIIPRNNIDLTIEDTNAAHTGILANTSASVITKPVPGTVYIKGGTLSTEATGADVITILKDGACVIEGGCLKVINRGYAINNEGLLTISGGTIIGRDSYIAPVLTNGDGYTEMTGGAIYAGNRTTATCFEAYDYSDPTYGDEHATVKLPEGTYDGGAIVLDSKWAIPGTRYINYHMPEGAEMQPGNHYYSPGASFDFPECNVRDGLPFAGWSTEDGNTGKIVKGVTPGTNTDFELYPIWRYTDIAEGVSITMTPESVDPAPGSELTELNTVILAFGSEYGDVYTKDDATTFGYVSNSSTGETVSQLSLDYDWDGNIYATLASPITKPGNYTLFIPGGVIGNDDYVYDDYRSGRCNPNLTYSYKIVSAEGETNNVVTTPANGATVSKIEEIIFSFPDDENAGTNFENMYAVITNAAGEEITGFWSDDVEYGGDNYELLIATLSEPVTTPGEYRLSIPKGFFQFDWWERDCSELTFTYHVDTDTSVDNIISDTEESGTFDVYDIYGRKVLVGATHSDLSRLPKGIYLAGGKKVLVR